MRKSKAKKGPISSSARAGIAFPVGRCNSMLKRGRYADRAGVGAGIFMAAVLEYLTSEVMELAGENCKTDKRTRITPRHIQLAVRNDPEINKIMCEAMIAEGGVLPNIEDGLFPKKKK